MFRETYRKVPCITVLEGNDIQMINCKLKGDTINDAHTAGLVAIDANVKVERCLFTGFKSGGIMVQAKPQNRIEIIENDINQCNTNGIYV